MGNPLSPIIADLVMEDLLEEAETAMNVQIPYLKKYVDDLFLSLPPDKIEIVQKTFNLINKHIQFTVEVEVNNRLPFLDMVLVRQNDQSIKTEWYTKEIASGRFLNYHSCHPMHQKMNVATNFAHRVTEFSTNLNLQNIKSIIHRHLRVNDYPTTLINRIINKVGRKISNNTAMGANRMEDEHATKTFCSLTNIEGLTPLISKTLRKAFPTIQIASKNTKKVSTLLPPLKDKTPKDEQSNVVYKIQCADCNACYVGMTTTKLKMRISGHRSNVKKLKTLQDAGYTNTDAEMYSIREKNGTGKPCSTTGTHIRFGRRKNNRQNTQAEQSPDPRKLPHKQHRKCSQQTHGHRQPSRRLCRNSSLAEKH